MLRATKTQNTDWTPISHRAARQLTNIYNGDLCKTISTTIHATMAYHCTSPHCLHSQHTGASATNIPRIPTKHPPFPATLPTHVRHISTHTTATKSVLLRPRSTHVYGMATLTSRPSYSSLSGLDSFTCHCSALTAEASVEAEIQGTHGAPLSSQKMIIICSMAWSRCEWITHAHVNLPSLQHAFSQVHCSRHATWMQKWLRVNSTIGFGWVTAYVPIWDSDLVTSSPSCSGRLLGCGCWGEK